MSAGIQVFHLTKRISIASGLNRHITRKQFVTDGEETKVEVWVPKNAVPEKTVNNVELVSREFTNSEGETYELTLQQAVDKRIREAGIKPKKGQATCLEMIFSGSHDVMVAMDEEKLRDWANDTLEWAQKKWGKENVVSASFHVDERTPHIHMIVVPIVTGQSRRTRSYKLKAEEKGKPIKSYNIDHSKLRLCANEVYTSGKLYEYHDSYAEDVSLKYGLGRGVRAEPGSKKSHMDSIGYNRLLAVQAAEHRALIDELTADYDEKKEKFQKEIHQFEEDRNTVSSALNEEQDKLTKAKSKTKKAEKESKEAEKKLADLDSRKTEMEKEVTRLQGDKDTLSTAVETEKGKLEEAKSKTKKAEERLSSQEEAITKNTGIINKQVADFNARKVELDQTKTDIETNKQTITQQEQTISDNDATIKKQEKRKASTVINDDAADREILEKYSTVTSLASEVLRLKRSVTDKKTELATIDANIQNRRKQMAAKVDLDTIPRKGLMGYRTEDVDKYLESVNTARLRLAMNSAPTDIKVDGELQKEVTRLRTVEDDFNDFKNSPERLRQQIEYLETEAKRRSIAEILKYALKKVVEVIRFTVDKTPDGEDIFAKFTIKGDTTQYAGRINANEYICYTSRSLNSLQEVKEHWEDKIWYVLGRLSEIQAKRQKEDALSRYSTKLSTLLKKRVEVKDYVTDGEDYLLYTSDKRKYLVQKSGKTYSTTDERVTGIKEAYNTENVSWTDHGDIKKPEIRRGQGRSR